MLFGDPDMGFFQSFFDFIVFVVIFIGALYVFGLVTRSKTGNKTEGVVKRIVVFIATPFYKIRSKLPHDKREFFDLFLILLYCAGAGLIIIYSVK